jgi:EAL domain-containing protein (putative c-di-GMP-specific phosphodiesterase class I)
MSNKFINVFKNIASEKKPKLNEKQLLKKIKNGFENQEFKMYLQFIVDSQKNKIVSAETLSRWEDSTGEVIFPGTYIGLMEKSGLITRFDYYMFEMVCKKLAAWKDTEFSELTLSCNITRITISEKDFVNKIKEISQKYDFDRRKLLIEITEDSIEKNLVTAMYNIIKVKELGFRIALDDIGSGYTSLISLCEYPIDVVKIDRAILLLAGTQKGKKLLFGIVSLAHYLNLKVVCEGVETEEQKNLVAESDCDYIQGWYYSKSLPEEKAEKFARDYMSKV